MKLDFILYCGTSEILIPKSPVQKFLKRVNLLGKALSLNLFSLLRRSFLYRIVKGTLMIGMKVV